MASIACIPSVPAPGDAAGLRERARGALLGLAVGDALGAPAENMKPSEIRARWGRIEGFVADEPAGTDDTEYAIFSGLLLARHGSALTVAHVEAAWHEWIADLRRGPVPGRGLQRARHAGEPPPRPRRPHLRPAPARLERRPGHAGGAVRRLRGGPPGRGRPAGRDRRLGEPRRRGHLRRPGGRGGSRGGDGGRARRSRWSPPRWRSSRTTPGRPARCAARWRVRATGGEAGGPLRRSSSAATRGPTWPRRRSASPSARSRRPTATSATSVLTAVNMGRDADTTAAVAGALAGATRGAAAIPADVGRGDRPGARQLPAVDGGPSRPGRRGAADAGEDGRGTPPARIARTDAPRRRRRTSA